MALKRIEYFVGGKKKTIYAKPVSVFSSGLLFKKRSPPLFFSMKREKKFSIFSVFCRPFRAIWLDEKMRATKITDVKSWKINISGRGKHLLEIPLEPRDNGKAPTGRIERFK